MKDGWKNKTMWTFIGGAATALAGSKFSISKQTKPGGSCPSIKYRLFPEPIFACNIKIQYSR